MLNAIITHKGNTLQTTISNRAAHCDEYDDTIVRQMVECIKVYKDGKIEVIFGGGYTIEDNLNGVSV